MSLSIAIHRNRRNFLKEILIPSGAGEESVPGALRKLAEEVRASWRAVHPADGRFRHRRLLCAAEVHHHPHHSKVGQHDETLEEQQKPGADCETDSCGRAPVLQIHLLNEEERGATMEAALSRMKTVQGVLEVENRNKPGPSLRFVAASATFPNVQDVRSPVEQEEGVVPWRPPLVNGMKADAGRPGSWRKTEQARTSLQIRCSLRHVSQCAR
ncbi:hypothetical protein CEXT_450441, partial [Caerostris extrusa]